MERGRVRVHYLKPWLFGIIAGVIVVVPVMFLPVKVPVSYSFCLSCHTHDLINGLINWFSGLYLPQTFVSRKILLLTSPAVIAGAFTAAAIFGERKKVKAERPVQSFLSGAFIMLIGIIIFGCPTRLIIRAGFGEVYGIVAVAGMVVGIVAASYLIRFKWKFGR